MTIFRTQLAKGVRSGMEKLYCNSWSLAGGRTLNGRGPWSCFQDEIKGWGLEGTGDGKVERSREREVGERQKGRAKTEREGSGGKRQTMMP